MRNKEKYVYTQSFNTRIVRFECNHGRAEIKLASNENITLTFYSTPETEAFWQKVDTGFILRKSANTNKVTTCKDSVCIDWEVVLPN